MDSEYQAQLQRLQQFRRSFAEQRIRNAVGSAQQVAPSQSDEQWRELLRSSLNEEVENEPVHDPLIFPGLYAPSGFDMMGILVRVRTRPNPVIEIGSIDSSVALVLCDTALPDNPIVYCSEPFEALTGYSSNEIIGKNCRFLQYLHPNVLNNVNGVHEVDPMNTKARLELRDKIARVKETQVRLVNYTKGGVKFFNLLTVIPIAWDEGEIGKRYMVGFQAQDISQFR